MRLQGRLLKALTILVVTTAIVLGVVTCGKKDSGEIRIGVITPLSGEGATYGEATKRGADLAVEEINKAGGIQGSKVRLIYEDDKIDPQEGAKAIQKLISIDKVPIILGAFGSSVTLAIAPIAEREHVVLFSASSTADAIKDAGDYIFRNVPPNSQQGKSAAEFAIDKLNAKYASVLFMNNDYGISLSKSFEGSFTQKGGNILSIDSYSAGDRDFRAQLAKIKNQTPDVIFYPGHYQESGLILKQAKELGIKVPFVGGDGSYSPELLTIAGNSAEGSYYTLMAMGYGVADDEIKEFMRAFKAKYNAEPDVYSAYAYDAMRIIIDAIGNGGYTSEGIKRALYAINNFKGVTGFTSFDQFGEVDKQFYIYVVWQGTFVRYKSGG